MPLSALYTALIALIWTQTVLSKLDCHHSARITITNEAAFKYFAIQGGVQKMVKGESDSKIYARSPDNLYVFKSENSHKTQNPDKVFNNTCADNQSFCSHDVFVLTEGRNGNGAFICERMETKSECCNLNAKHEKVDCWEIERAQPDINEAFLYAGDTLYYTKSGEGLYKINKREFTWPKGFSEQKHVKLISNKGKDLLGGKVYSFYIEKNQNTDPETPVWIPLISQYCMADKGGNKNQLQFRWTSMITARLFCGDKKNRLTFTELLDVAVLETEDRNNSMIYALFKNEYDICAVCVYKMSKIIEIFSSSKFNESDMDSSNPGKCVENSKNLPTTYMKIMERRPMMKQQVEPEHGPLIFSHHQYTHLQVDSVKDRNNSQHNVLLMALGNGRVHKVLEKDSDILIITEYLPFKNKTHIHSMLLDRSTKKLYLSSSSEVVQIDLKNCSQYGNNCDQCVQARDPYCGWDTFECSAAVAGCIQNVRSGNTTVCARDPSMIPRMSFVTDPPMKTVPLDSRYYLKCPITSQHASYSWKHEDKRMDCVSTDDQCLLLIESMREEDVGMYECTASENGYDRTITSYRLSIANNSSQQKVTSLALLCLMLLFWGTL